MEEFAKVFFAPVPEKYICDLLVDFNKAASGIENNKISMMKIFKNS